MTSDQAAQMLAKMDDHYQALYALGIRITSIEQKLITLLMLMCVVLFFIVVRTVGRRS